MKKNEEYQMNVSRDWLWFGVSALATLLLYFFLTEWIWIAFPLLFTSLAGALKRL